MNWTEGALARHSRRKGWNPSLTRQKEYFAKARAGKKQTSAAQSTFLPSYITRATPRTSFSAVNGSPALPPLSTRPQKFGDDQEESSTEVATTGSCVLTSGSASHDRRPSPSPTSHAKIEAKRRRLLQQGDWTGITLARPPEINFDSIRHDYLSKGKSLRGHNQPLPITKCDAGHDQRQISRFKSSQRHGAADSIRIRIGDRELRWSHGEGSARTAHTLRSFQTIQSPSCATSMPSSPPTLGSVISASSPAAAVSIASSRRRSSGRSTKIWKRKSPRSTAETDGVSAPFVPDGPRYVVQSIPPKLLHPTPSHMRALYLAQHASPGARSTVGSLVAETGKSPARSAKDMEAEAEWKAFLVRQGEDNDAASQIHEPNSVDSEHLPLYHNGERQAGSAASVDKWPLRSGGLHVAGEAVLHEREEAGLSSHSSTVHVDLSKFPKAQGSFSEVVSHSLRSDQNADSNPLDQWVVDPDVRDLLSRRHVTKNMMDLLEEELYPTAKEESKAPLERQNRSASEDELWKRFMFDDDPKEVVEKAGRLAAKETTRQILQERSAVRSDEVEAPASSSTHVPTNVDLPESVVIDLSKVCDSESDCGASREDESVQAVSVMAEHGSSSPKKSKTHNFKVHVPAPFVGRLASISTSDEAGAQPQSTVASLRGRRGTKWKRRWKSGRPEIRALPDFDEDPIEEDL